MQQRLDMLREAGISLASLVMLSAAAPSATDIVLHPGRWHVVGNLKADTANGKALSQPVGNSEDFYSCLSDADRDPTKMIEKNELEQGCHAYQAHAAKGAISFTAICPADEDGSSYDMSGAGTYSSERISLRVDAHAEGGGNQATLSGTVTANWAGPCQGNEE